MVGIILVVVGTLALLVASRPPQADPYVTLGLDRSATSVDIKRADNARFVAINEAYELLSNSRSRANYDATGDPEVPAYYYGSRSAGAGYGSAGMGASLSSPAVYLTAASYAHVVEGARDPLWVVLLYADHDRASHNAMHAFNKVAISLAGVARFGRVEVSAEWRLARLFRISRVPAILFISEDGHFTRFRGSFSHLRSAILDRLPDTRAPLALDISARASAGAARGAMHKMRAWADRGWAVVALCSSRKKPSPLWRSLAAAHQRTTRFVFISVHARAATDAMDKLGCVPGEQPIVLVASSSKVVPYSGSLARPALEAYFLHDAHAAVPRLSVDVFDVACRTGCLIVNSAAFDNGAGAVLTPPSSFAVLQTSFSANADFVRAVAGSSLSGNAVLYVSTESGVAGLVASGLDSHKATQTVLDVFDGSSLLTSRTYPHGMVPRPAGASASWSIVSVIRSWFSWIAWLIQSIVSTLLTVGVLLLFICPALLGRVRI
ncbi:uncharacterized protein AMSG_01404 [Thecamonas trahens ATCC 50062]|uniref:J domain-containing protein n=1 Tax=Thecamonas trahens ATCC 50062 TaxID=461836 RepID=A0A0L0DQJ2_THETB|nr:hypothetical protein AMSG_01404 [Thecamonas trahens ATCC 50062]KNC53693.1 hypothetical protein AMSG_01404 [Thecamonas trahens ATCC 50062]|eukprot:XP_013762007.1 hypothetical protein AMSG_01404 [Thecamonas trahens ATCC 50062]